jgi:tetratricopeptide (TPR) repeat protein
MQPTVAAWWNYRCWDRAILGRLELAMADCNQALQLRPGDANALDSRGLVYLKLGKFDDAIADYDAALKINPRIAASLYGRGIAKQRKGDSAGGDADVAAGKAMRASIADDFKRYGVN